MYIFTSDEAFMFNLNHVIGMGIDINSDGSASVYVSLIENNKLPIYDLESEVQARICMCALKDWLEMVTTIESTEFIHVQTLPTKDIIFSDDDFVLTRR